MLRRVAWAIVISMPLFAILGCSSPEVEYPEDPTPPPSSAPGVSSAPGADQDG